MLPLILGSGMGADGCVPFPGGVPGAPSQVPLLVAQLPANDPGDGVEVEGKDG